MILCYVCCVWMVHLCSCAPKVLEISNSDIHELQSAGSTQDLLEIVPMRFLFGETALHMHRVKRAARHVYTNPSTWMS